MLFAVSFRARCCISTCLALRPDAVFKDLFGVSLSVHQTFKQLYTCSGRIRGFVADGRQDTESWENLSTVVKQILNSWIIEG